MIHAYRLLALLTVFCVPTIFIEASPRISTEYTINVDILSSGGGYSESSIYSNQASLGTVSGASTVTQQQSVTSASGFIAQLYEVKSLLIHSTSLSVNEGSQLQLGASLVLDDATLLNISSDSINWVTANGPIKYITRSGLLAADIVYQDIYSSINGQYGQFTSGINITILNTDSDNYGSFALDGLDDLWQIQNFGINSAQAGPNLDPDMDGQTNLSEFIAGTNPLDTYSVFRFKIEKTPETSISYQLIFSPILSGRTYTISYKNDLTSTQWIPLTGAAVKDISQQRTVTDQGAISASRFYRVEIHSQ